MKTAKTLTACSSFMVFAGLLIVSEPAISASIHSSFQRSIAKVTGLKIPSLAIGRTKTEAEVGEPIGPVIDCDGDGLVDDSRIDFDGDGVPDECIEGTEIIPEPPFQQTYTPSSETFYSQLPAVGWNAQYQCGDGLYEVTLRRPSENQLEYVSEGLTLSSDIVYDDIDPNLNQPLVIQDPADGLRYSFSQEQNGEFYEYAIADYSGNVGLYVYQTGEQIVAIPCTVVSGAVPATVSSRL